MIANTSCQLMLSYSLVIIEIPISTISNFHIKFKTFQELVRNEYRGIAHQKILFISFKQKAAKGFVFEIARSVYLVSVVLPLVAKPSLCCCFSVTKQAQTKIQNERIFVKHSWVSFPRQRCVRLSCRVRSSP